MTTSINDEEAPDLELLVIFPSGNAWGKFAAYKSLTSRRRKVFVSDPTG
jgi:hypothetical protein